MELTVEVVGEDTHRLEVPDDATAADLVEPLPVSIHEVSVMVDGRPLPEDAPVPDGTEAVQVVRLIKGG